MAGNNNSGIGPKFRMPEAQFIKAVEQYKRDSNEGMFPRPSLSHFCARLGTTEEYLTAWLDYSSNPGSAYYNRAETLKIFLTWLRGEMFSSGKYDSAAAKKYVELQLGKDHGDGVTYSGKDGAQQAPTRISVVFGGGDPRAESARK